MNITTISRVSSVAIFLGTVAWLAGSPDAADEIIQNTSEEPPQTVEVRDLLPSRPVQIITLDGSTEPLHDTTVIAKASGEIKEIHFSIGDLVPAGSALLKLDDALQSAAYTRAKSDLQVSKGALSRAENLSLSGTVSSVQLEERKAEYERKKESLAIAESAFSDTLVTSPVDGQIADILVSPHEDINSGAKLVRIVDNSTLIASAQIPQSQINSISVGMSSQVLFPGGVKVPGEITFISPVADFSTRSFPIEITIPNDDLHLRSGSTVSILIEDISDPSFIIPQEALVISDEGEIGVHAVDAGSIVSFIPVDITSVSADGLIVDTRGRSSLSLITKGQSTVSPGDKVISQSGDRK